MTDAPPEHLDIGNETHLRWFRVDDAEAVARAVGESLDHLRPWMPWADERSADPAFQRERLRDQPRIRARGEEWQYGLFGADDRTVLGSFGLMTRRGPGTLEIGYWLHVEAVGKGRATATAAALTDAGFALGGIRRMLIACDEANVRSAAIPRRLGYTLARVDRRAPEAPGECGRMQLWTKPRPREGAAPTP